MPIVPQHPRGRPGSSDRGRRCAKFDQARSQFVDGSIDHDAREALLRHLADCTSCRHDIDALRRIRALLHGRTEPSRNSQPSSRLQERLVSIAEGTEEDPLWSRPFRRVEAKPLPSRRRQVRRRAAAAATAFGTLVIAGAGVGYVAAPASLASIGDPTEGLRAEFAAARAELPLTSGPATAVMMVGDRLGSTNAALAAATASPSGVGTSGGGIATDRPGAGATSAAGSSDSVLRYRPAVSTTDRTLTAGQAATALRLGERAGARVAYSGTEEVVLNDGGRTTRADVAVDFAPGQGSEVSVSDAVGSQVGSGSVPAPSSTENDLATMLAVRYRLSGLADVAVLGRRVSVVEARRYGDPEGDPPSARWWIDQQTGLLLGRQTYDASGALVQSAMLTSLRTGGDRYVAFPTPRLAVSVANAALTPASSTELNRAGWNCEQTVAGLPLTQVNTDVAADPGLVHLVYTDGVWTISVFERRGLLAAAPAGSVLDPGLNAYLNSGTPRTASWQSGNAVITVATDGPAALLAQAVHSLPHAEHHVPTTMERVQAGWSRVVSSMFG